MAKKPRKPQINIKLDPELLRRLNAAAKGPLAPTKTAIILHGLDKILKEMESTSRK
jgi:predicted DNA-binding protein